MVDPPPMERRPVPGTRLRTSPLAVRLDASPTAFPEPDEAVVARIARVRRGGITTFEVGTGPHSARVERWLARAFPSEDEDLAILADRSSEGLAQEEGAAHPPATNDTLERLLRRSISASASRLSPHAIDLLVWHSRPEDPDGDARAHRALEQLRTEGVVQGWIHRIGPADRLPPTSESRAAPPPLYAGPLSVLDHRLLGALEERSARTPFGFFADDPLGRGRLDGSEFGRSLAERAPGEPPRTVAELQREFDPVLRLAFLTGGSRRTLAQASLRFALHWPWVCSAIVPLPPPERLAELERWAVVPELSDEEIARIAALPDRA